jgi:hypothetical protein
MEVLILAFIIFNYINNMARKILYESDSKRIIINGSKEGLYDPSIINASEIEEVVEDKSAIIIHTISGKKIRLIGLGNSKKDVIEDLQKIININKK